MSILGEGSYGKVYKAIRKNPNKELGVEPKSAASTFTKQSKNLKRTIKTVEYLVIKEL